MERNSNNRPFRSKGGEGRTSKPEGRRRSDDSRGRSERDGGEARGNRFTKGSDSRGSRFAKDSDRSDDSRGRATGGKRFDSDRGGRFKKDDNSGRRTANAGSDSRGGRFSKDSDRREDSRERSTGGKRFDSDRGGRFKKDNTSEGRAVNSGSDSRGGRFSKDSDRREGSRERATGGKRFDNDRGGRFKKDNTSEGRAVNSGSDSRGGRFSKDSDRRDDSRGRNSGGKRFDNDRGGRFKKDDSREERYSKESDRRENSRGRSFEDRKLDHPKGGRFQKDENRERRFERRDSEKEAYPQDDFITRKVRQGDAVNNDKKYDKVRRDRPSYDTVPVSENDKKDGIRLNRFIANAGICSRRDADKLISEGLVTVNGDVITEMGTIVSIKDKVEFEGKVLNAENKVYVLLNKPKDVVTTLGDPHAKRTVIDLVKGACDERIYPVGRLDKNTTGVLLLTNDGELTKRLTHPKHNHRKIYHAFLDKPVLKRHLEEMAQGLTLDDGLIAADSVSYVEGNKEEVGIEIHSGKNRIVRRIFEHLGYDVVKLDRVYFCGLTKKGMGRGEWRYLSEKEVKLLKVGMLG